MSLEDFTVHPVRAQVLDPHAVQGVVHAVVVFQNAGDLSTRVGCPDRLVGGLVKQGIDGAALIFGQAIQRPHAVVSRPFWKLKKPTPDAAQPQLAVQPFEQDVHVG